MKMIRLLSVVLTLLWSATVAWADLPFRNHRYDAFKVLPVTSEDVVFVGNSITNMNEWWEAFRNHRVKNRGVSGAITDEALANLEAVIAGQPKKIFFMIGTNDLGTQGINTADYVLANTRRMVDRVQKESPRTEIYIQSILPSQSGLRTLEVERQTNAALKALCEERGLTYIDLWDDLQGILNNTHSMDGLHLKASGYKIWCDKVAPYVNDAPNAKSTYAANTNTAQNANGLGGAYGMRATVFSVLPVHEGDVLVIGDEMIHGGEWHELLQSGKVKSRGTAWGYPGPSLSQTLSELPVIFNKTSGSCRPAKVLLYAGVSDVNGNTAISTLVSSYKNIVSRIKTLAPEAKVYIMGLQPTNNASVNTQRVKEFNGQLQSMADADDALSYIDLYTDFVSSRNVGKSEYFVGNYLYGMGYVKVAQKMAAAMADPDIIAITDEEAATLVARFESRSALGNAITVAEQLQEGNGVGQYTSEALAPIKQKVDEAYALLTNAETSADKLAQAADEIEVVVQQVLNAINMPQLSANGKDYWYQLYTPQRENRYLSSQGVGAQVLGDNKNAYAASMWKFESRADGAGWNIVNRKDGSYLSPVAAYNKPISTAAAEPAKGWTLSYSNAPGTFIISSDKVQLNQTQSLLGYAVYNWSEGESGTDRNDTGCRYAIVPFEGDPEEEVFVEGMVQQLSQLVNGWYRIEVATGSNAEMQKIISDGKHHILAANNEFRQNASNYYSLKYAAPEADAPTKQFIYITKSGNGFVFHGIGGHRLNENCTSPRSNTPGTTAVAINNGQATIGKWAPYFSGGPEEPYVGKMSNTSHTYYIYNVPQSELDAYDMYTVQITGAVAADEVGNDVRVSCSRQDYVGLQKVYNGGYFFFPNGTAITAADFSAPAQGGKQAKISISGKNIQVAYEATAGDELKYSTADQRTWYYIVSASSHAYCAGKAIRTNGDGPLTYTELALDPTMIWCFEKDEKGKVAIRNYGGKYMSKTQDKNHAEAGMTDAPAYNYTITPWTGSSQIPNAYTIKSDASAQPIHAQQDNVVIVTWVAENNGASLWAFQELTEEELSKQLTVRDLQVQHSAMGVGIGGKNYGLLRMKFEVEGLSGDAQFEAITGSVNSDAVSQVRLYSVADAFEYYDGKEGNVLLGQATPNTDGDFTISFSQPVSLQSGAAAYYWLVADISEEAKEGQQVDAEITAYTLSGKSNAVKAGNPQHAATVFLSASTVEYLGTHGSRYYRIPAITRANNGWLVAVTDKRWGSNGDLPNNIDVVARVSKDDGATWTEPVTIAGTAALGGDYGHGDPAIVTDRVTGDIFVLVCSKQGFFYGTPTNPQLIKVIVSHDNGLTWDAPVDITDQLYGAGCADAQRAGYHALFPSSGSFTQTADGKLLCVAPVRYTTNTNHATFGAHIISSSDHGKTWTMSNNAALLDADESKIVELDGGDWLVSSRHAGGRYYATSSNEGKSWSSRKVWSELYEPGCNGDLIRLTSRSAGADKNRLLHSIPNAGSRQNVTVFLSTDEGGSWPVKKSICPKGSAYSSLTVLPDGTIGCYYEEDGLEGGYQMRFVRFSLEWLTDGADSISGEEVGIGCIEAMPADVQSGAIYDLQGRRIQGTPGRGVYIQNGQKFIAR